MSFVVGVGLCALLQAEAGVAEGLQLEPVPTPPPASTAEGAPPKPEIQRPKSAAPAEPPAAPPVVAPAPESVAPEPVAAPPPEPVPAETEWPSSEPVVTEPGPAVPEAAPEALPVAADAPAELNPEPALRLPDRNGRGLMIGSIAAGTLGWAMSLGSIGLITRGCDGLGDCLGDVETFVYLTGVRWAANGTAMGLAIPAGVYRARYEATKEAIDGTPARDTDLFVKGGAAALGVGAAGWVILRIGLFSFLQNCSGNGCGIGYLAGLQTSFALATAGSGLLSYGLAHKEQKRKFGSAVQVRVMPQLSPQYSGLSLAGRF